MRCSQLAYPIGLLVLSGTLVVPGFSSTNSDAVAEQGPKPRTAVNDSGSTSYYSGHWYDGYGSCPTNDPYWYENYRDEYFNGGGRAPMETHEEEPDETAIASEINPDGGGPDDDQTRQHEVDRAELDYTENYRYYDDYDYDYKVYGHQGYEKHSAPQAPAKETDVEEADELSGADMYRKAGVVDHYGYWGDPTATSEQHSPSPSDAEALIETGDIPNTDALETIDTTYGDYNYRQYNYGDGYCYNEEYGEFSREQESDADVGHEAHHDYEYEYKCGYEYDYEYDYYYNYEVYGFRGYQKHDDHGSSPKEAEIEQADDLSDADMYREAGVVDHYGYWEGPNETSEEHRPLPSDAEVLIETGDALNTDDLTGDTAYRDFSCYEYCGDYYHGQEYERYSRDYESDTDVDYGTGHEYDDCYNYEHGYDHECSYEFGYEHVHSDEQGTDCRNEVDTQQSIHDDTINHSADATAETDYYDYDYDHCEYDCEHYHEYGTQPAAREQTVEQSYDTATATAPSRYMDDLDPFAWPAQDLLQTADKSLLRMLNRLFEEPSGVRGALFKVYIEELGPEAVDFVARFKESFDNEMLMLHDDLPGVAALLAAYRIVEQGDFGMDEAVDALTRNFNHLSPDWIEDVSLIIAEQPSRRVRSDHAPSDGGGQVLRAVISASAISVNSVGVRLSTVLKELMDIRGRLISIGDAVDWTTPGTAAIRNWIAR